MLIFVAFTKCIVRVENVAFSQNSLYQVHVFVLSSAARTLEQLTWLTRGVAWKFTHRLTLSLHRLSPVHNAAVLLFSSELEQSRKLNKHIF